MGVKGSGRRPLPTAVKNLRGNPGKRKSPPGELEAPVGSPDIPEWLSERAKMEWRAIVPELLALKVLSKIDRMALAAYCEAFDDWLSAIEDIKEHGRIFELSLFDREGQEVGTKLVANPAIAHKDRAAKRMKSFLIEFGMTPASRSRIRLETPKPEDPFDAYMQQQAASKDPAKRPN